MRKAPESYLDHQRLPLLEALALEGGTIEEATVSLRQKGYFTAPPRPWMIGFKDRGLGRGGLAVLDKFGDLVVETPNRETAEFIVEAINAYSK